MQDPEQGMQDPEQFQRQLLRKMALLDRTPAEPQESFPAKVHRLRDAGLLPPNIACLMLGHAPFRNLVVHHTDCQFNTAEKQIVCSIQAELRAWLHIGAKTAVAGGD